MRELSALYLSQEGCVCWRLIVPTIFSVLRRKRIHTTIVNIDAEMSDGLVTVRIIRIDYPLLLCIVLTCSACGQELRPSGKKENSQRRTFDCGFHRFKFNHQSRRLHGYWGSSFDTARELGYSE